MDLFTNQESRLSSSFCRGGSCCSVLCSCGRTHFVSESGHGDYEYGELEGLLEKSKESPRTFVDWCEYSYIPSFYIGGECLVVGCECGKAVKYANFIEAYADSICDYLRLYYKETNEKLEANLDSNKKNLEKLNFGTKL